MGVVRIKDGIYIIFKEQLEMKGDFWGQKGRSRHRIGHIALNQSLFIRGIHVSGLSVKCDLPETVEPILIKWTGYDKKRLQFTEAHIIEINQISFQKLVNKDVTI